MSERYQKLSALPENLYLEGAPLLIAAGALLKDNQDGRALVQLKLQNLNQSRLVACKVSIRAFDPSGAELEGIADHAYLDLTVDRGGTFGTQEPIYLPDHTTRSFSVAVTQAVFQDGEVWQSPGGEWRTVTDKRRRPAELFEDPEVQKQYAFELHENYTYVPVQTGNLFLCACGAVNFAKDATCSKCRRNFAELLQKADLEDLTRKKDARLAREEAARLEQEKKAEEERLERERKAEEERKLRAQQEEERRIAAEKAKKRNKKIAAVAAVIVVLGIAITVITTQVIIPGNKYKAAEALLEAGDYKGAAAAFTELGEYKDAAERILETYYCWGEWYQESGKLQQAKNAFINAGNYSDAPQRAEELHDIAYNMGFEKMQGGDYQAARDCFRLAADKYSDALDYRYYCEIKAINFGDGNIHDLAEVMTAFRAIKDEALTEELKSISQIQMVMKLEGTWKEDTKYYPDTLVFHDGKVEYTILSSTFEKTLFYVNGIYVCDFSSSMAEKYGEKLTNIGVTTLRYDGDVYRKVQ